MKHKANECGSDDEDQLRLNDDAMAIPQLGTWVLPGNSRANFKVWQS